MHGFWDEYKNIFRLVEELGLEGVFTDYALQGQYSPRGLEAVWPIYRNEMQLPTGLGQALFTRFNNLGPADLATAAPLVAAFSEILVSEEAFDKYDQMSFQDLCKKTGRVAQTLRRSIRANDSHWALCARGAVLSSGGSWDGIFLCSQVTKLL